MGSVSHSSPPATCSHTFWCLDDHLSLSPFLSNFTLISSSPWPLSPVRTRATESLAQIPLQIGMLLLLFLLDHLTSSTRRPPAWGQGARSSPTFSPGPARQQQQQQQPSAPATPMTFPPLSQTNGTRSDNARDRVLQALAALTVRRDSCFSSFRPFLIYSTGFNYHTSYKIRPTLRGTPCFHHRRG